MNDQIFRLLGRTTRVSHRYMGNQLEKYGLTRGQPRVLRHLANHPSITQKELITHMDIRPATLTRMLQRMEKNGLISRTPSKNDQRVMTITLTDLGYQAHLTSEQVHQDMEDQLLALITEEERDTLCRVLKKINRHIQAKEEEEHS
jgi:DNA-binding MarR family transcriptional regulator